jgi:hypothetical protein
VEKKSRLGSRDLVASGVKFGPHGGRNSKMKSWTVFWLSLKTKDESGIRGCRVMSGDWRRLHQVCMVSGGSSGNHWVPRSIHQAKIKESKTELQQLQTGLTGEEHRSDRCATMQSGDFKAEDTRQDRKVCVETKQICGRSASIRIYPQGACIPS